MEFCTNHPDREVHARGLCRSCYVIWHQKVYDVSEEKWAERYREQLSSVIYDRRPKENIPDLSIYDHQWPTNWNHIPELITVPCHIEDQPTIGNPFR